MAIKLGQYKGSPTLTLISAKMATSGDPKDGFTFGLAKAKLIVENFEAIRQFAATAGASVEDILQDFAKSPTNQEKLL